MERHDERNAEATRERERVRSADAGVRMQNGRAQRAQASIEIGADAGSDEQVLGGTSDHAAPREMAHRAADR